MDSLTAGHDGGITKQHKEREEENSLPLENEEDRSEDENSDLNNSNTPPTVKPKAETNVQREVHVDFVAEKIKEEPAVIVEGRHEDQNASETKNLDAAPAEKLVAESNIQGEKQVEYLARKIKGVPPNIEVGRHEDESSGEVKNFKLVEESNYQREKQVESLPETNLLTGENKVEIQGGKGTDDSNREHNDLNVDLGNLNGAEKNLEDATCEEESEPVFYGTGVPGMDVNENVSTPSGENDSVREGSAWPEKAVAIKNFVREKSLVAVSSFVHRLSGKSDDGQDLSSEKGRNVANIADPEKAATSQEAEEFFRKGGDWSRWNPLGLIGISHDTGPNNDVEHTEEEINKLAEPIAMKGRIILYTKLGSKECKAARLFLHYKRLRYVEINIDVYPTRKLELERLVGSSAVPRVFFNEVLLGGLSELKDLDECGELAEKIEYVISEAPSSEAPLSPLSGEDDTSGGTVDELAVIVRKMKNSIVVKDRFYKMRRFTNCFVGSEAVDFLSEDQYLEREEAVEFGRKLAIQLFIQHVLDENLFEDGNDVYRFLDDDPSVSQCQNIPRGIIEVKPKPATDVSSRLRFMCYAINEAYTSEDGKHVDYRSIHGSEEFARYLRIVEELQRVEVHDMPREEKLAFFINLYNMMAIHAILVLGHPLGVLERRKLFGEFKYVIEGCTYSLLDIRNGILRGNQRPPYTLTKPFGLKDKRLKVCLPYPEPLVHFALVFGARSGPALRCYSPGDIDKELMDAAHNFLTSGGLIVDLDCRIASINKILRWYSVDFGKNDVEVLKHAANYLEPADSQALLELLDKTQLKVVDQPFDWGLNY